jgi:hypothetical protein
LYGVRQAFFGGQDLQADGGQDIWNASWYCSSCFSTVAEIATKIESFSHTECNQPEFGEPQEIVRRVVDLAWKSWERFSDFIGRPDALGLLSNVNHANHPRLHALVS